MRTCEHSIPIDDYCPKCEAIERKTKPVPVYTSKDAALDYALDRDEEYERATGEEQMRRDDRIMRGGR
jgi:hypothetical protein